MLLAKLAMHSPSGAPVAIAGSAAFRLAGPGGHRPMSRRMSPIRHEATTGCARRAAFLDRDGVLNVALQVDGLPTSPATVADMQVLPGVEQACARLKAAGFLLVMVTNQPDIAHGKTTRAAV